LQDHANGIKAGTQADSRASSLKFYRFAPHSRNSGNDAAGVDMPDLPSKCLTAGGFVPLEARANMTGSERAPAASRGALETKDIR
jgi:hypothetical protein